jgi:RNA:NAD 2'-phosphotransferase (TPT1/KptA family)
MASVNADSRHDIRQKLRARYGHSISDQEVDLIIRVHARHGAEKVVVSFFAAKTSMD